MKIKSRVQSFSERFGGKWKYNGWGWPTYECDDGKRYINRVSTCLCDYSCNCGIALFLYGDGIPKRIL